MPKNKEEWCWWFENADEEGNRWYGTFASRQAAIDNARDRVDTGTYIRVATVSHLNPVDFIDDAVTALLERMDESIFDLVYSDDPIFEVGEEERAQVDLTRILRKWAQRWVSTAVWIPVGEGELVIL